MGDSLHCYYEWQTNQTSERGRFGFGMVTNHSFNAHWHTAMEFAYIIEGEVLACVDEEQYHAHAGDIILCGRDQIHYMNSLESGSKMVLLIFDPDYVQEALLGRQFAITFLNAAKVRELNMPPETFREIQHCFTVLPYIKENRYEGYLSLCENYLKLIIALLMRYVPLKEDDVDNRISSTVKIMQHAIDYIIENYSENLTLEQLARNFYISPFYLSRLFGKYVGVPFKKYLNHVRVTEAINLMMATTNSIQSIAQNCGFNNIRTFNRVFKEYTQMTPKAYIKARRS
ncbi:MAG: AraC family transcriptional regulator [Clostridiales bacterium]|nr:AraC family transcriptional regulator [Clostridiales bacterium]